MHAAVLRYFDQVAESGSIRTAAEVLNVAPSAITRQILNLESELGCKLFLRLPTGMKLTTAGDVFLRHTRRTLSDWRNTAGELNALAGETAGEVRILATPPLIVSVLLGAIEALIRQHPRVRFHVTDANIVSKTEQMKLGQPDVALLPFDRRYRQYELVDQLNVRVGVVVTPNHPLADEKMLTLTQCAAYPVLMVQDMWVQRHSDDEFQETGAEYQPRITSSSWPLAREATRRGLGVGFFSSVGVAKELAEGDLIFVPLDIPGYVTSDLSLYVNTDRKIAPEVDVTVQNIKDKFAEVRAMLPPATIPEKRDVKPNARSARL